MPPSFRMCISRASSSATFDVSTYHNATSALQVTRSGLTRYPFGSPSKPALSCQPDPAGWPGFFTFFKPVLHLSTRPNGLDPVSSQFSNSHLISGQTIFNGPWILAYFGPIKPVQFSLFYKAPISGPIQGQNNWLLLAATTIRGRHQKPPSFASGSPSGQTPAIFLAKKKKIPFFFPNTRLHLEFEGGC